MLVAQHPVHGETEHVSWKDFCEDVKDAVRMLPCLARVLLLRVCSLRERARAERGCVSRTRSVQVDTTDGKAQELAATRGSVLDLKSFA